MRPRALGPDVTLHLGDCREVLPTLSQAAAIITDPPYGMDYGAITGGARGRSKTAPSLSERRIAGDDMPFDPSPLLRFTGAKVLWGANHYASRLPDARCWLVWDKREGGRPDDGADAELAWTSLAGPARLFRHLWRGMVKRGEESGQKRLHPTQKPIALMRWCIEQAGMPALVIDPYMGSGTTGVAAVQLGRAFVGVEIEQRHFDVACRRIEEALRSPPLALEGAA